MKVALVNPNRMKPAIAPIGLDYLADSLRAAGHDMRLVDLCFAAEPLSELKSDLQEFSPDVVGVTVRNTDDCYMAGQDYFLPFIREVVDEIKSTTTCPVVAGGVGFSVSPVNALKIIRADYGITGDGETAFLRLIETLKDKREPVGIPGLLIRKGDSIIATAPELRTPADLPLRSRSLADNSRYFREGGQAGFETKRGCGMGCIYCPEPFAKGKDWRLLPPEMVVAEISALYAQGVDHFHTCDSEFNMPLSHAIQVCEAIVDAGLGDKIRWYAYCAPEPFPDRLAQLMKAAGCAGIDFGADSGDDGQLARLCRHYKSKDIVSAVQMCKKYDIPLMLDLLIGGPGETQESVERTIRLTKLLDADCVGLSVGVRIYEGTPIADMTREAGPMEYNPEIYGQKADNPGFVRPVFFVSEHVGPEIVEIVRGLIHGDDRFFLPAGDDADSNYNYNDNSILVNAIASGCRGAYWDILRRLKQSTA